jgi:hypothetical protein
MPPQDRLQVACDSYGAYVSGDSRAWSRSVRNTEILTFRGDRICRADVYFGWNLHA